MKLNSCGTRTNLLVDFFLTENLTPWVIVKLLLNNVVDTNSNKYNYTTIIQFNSQM